MNRQGLVLTVAAVATIAGCLDPKWQSKRASVRTVPVPPPAEYVDSPSDPAAGDVRGTEVPNVKIDDIVIENTPAPVPQPAPEVLPPPPPPPAANTVYIVQPGDTISGISKRFNIKIPAIMSLNGLTNYNIRPRQKLLLPGDVAVGEQKSEYRKYTPDATKSARYGEVKNYKIQPGDTLSKIAAANKTTVSDIVNLNGLASEKIRAGRTIKVPVGTKGAAAAVKTTAVAPSAPKAAEQPKAPVQPPAEAPKAVEAAPSPVDDVEDINSLGAASVPPQETEANDYFIYKVKGGEDITGISIQFDISPTEIRQRNGLGEDAELAEGMELKLPLSARQ